ncbi:glutaminyl-peptide cyclotransferase [Gaetbulibacter saemankumensis]|uniref:glutaminyl-peptide cyclotransferase n=1 Tax=Gaetbulibacter saemankumensis TaxID=311208 RepID=UPI00048021F1|nr:glutaminyl-peptide cyclotransferase [Gaetbulibacter saemankumensis]
MNTIKCFTIIFLSILISGCGSSNGQKKNDFSIKTNTDKGNISNNSVLNLSLINKKEHEIDSIVYSIYGRKIGANTKLSDFKLGKHAIEATVYFNETKEVCTTSITILHSESPKVYTYKIINEYPHDITSYTQGLEFHNGDLYESTGQYKFSKLRKVDFKTGNVLKNKDLPNEYFGEGITILNNKIYQLTWRENIGFIYDINSFEKTSSFKYNESKEGWGLCNNGSTIYKSDGTENIWLLNPETLTEEDHIQVYTNKGKIIGINEMEWVNGVIYSNRYQKDGVAIINPENGAVIGVIDFSPLKRLVKQHEGLDVLNGIAYNTETKTLFVTGKHWDKLFEVEIIEK